MTPMSTDRALVLLRHAKSDCSVDQADIDRPLAKRGRRQAPEAGRWLALGVDRIDLAVVSPAKRTRSTWKLVAAELAHRPPVRVDDRVYAASAAELLAVVRELPEDLSRVVLVGHNPGLEDLATRLTGDEVRMPTSALAVLAVPGPWASIGETRSPLQAAGRPPAS
jgi:phosphohistidine phosphatase